MCIYLYVNICMYVNICLRISMRSQRHLTSLNQSYNELVLLRHNRGTVGVGEYSVDSSTEVNNSTPETLNLNPKS